VSELSEYLNARVPRGWSKTDVIEAFGGRVDRTTVYRYLSGRHPRRPSEAVLEAFVAVLPGTSIVELRRAAGQPLGEEEPWILPPEANRLNAGQRRAIEAFIRATVSAEDSSMVEEQQAAPLEVPAAARHQLEDYIEQLYASGRTDLADRLAATLATNSDTETASRATASDAASTARPSDAVSRSAGD
jgi:hypothetical protein